MKSPLLHDVYREPAGNTSPDTLNRPCVDSSVTKPASSPSVWKPVVTRVVLSGLALVGLAGVGAASMLAGLDGARANSPQVTSAHVLLGTVPPKPDVNAAPGSTTPRAGAQPPPAMSAPDPASPPVALACTGRTADGRVILNLATVADLRTLPGIGPKRADAILALRDKLKRFRRIQELRRVRGIGAKTLQKLAPKLLVDPPSGDCSAAVK